MLHVKFVAAALILLMVSVGTSSAEIYRWKDKNGVTHFSDTPPQEIEESEDDGEISATESVPEDSSTQDSDGQDTRSALESVSNILKELDQELPDQPAEDSDNGQQPSVELFVTSWCRYCKDAKGFFRSRGIPFTVYDIEKDEDARRRMAQLTSSRGVPFAVINGHAISGYSEEAYLQALQ